MPVTNWCDRLLTAEPAARRAPSVLNTQPVVLHRADDRLTVGWDPARTLTLLDPDGTALWISLGAFVEAMVLAAADSGVGVRVEPALDPGRRVFAHLVPGPLRRSHLGTAELTSRVTGVGRFAEPPPDLAEIDYLAAHAGLPQDVRVVGWDGNRGVDLVVRAHRWLFATAEPRQELRGWVRPDADDGIEPAALGLPPWRAKLFLTARGALDDGSADLLGGHPRGVGTVTALVSGAEPGDAVALARVGAALLRLGLQGIRHGLRLQWLPHVTACPSTRASLRALLDLADVPGTAHCILRIGTPEVEPPLSRRRITPIVGAARPT